MCSQARNRFSVGPVLLVGCVGVVIYLYRRGWREWRSEGVSLSSSRSLRRLVAVLAVEMAGGGTELREVDASANCCPGPENPVAGGALD